MRLRSRYDREIVRLAIPALGALAAEPLYLLVDTAIVGHLGRSQLAALGIAFTILGGLFAIFNFLQYGTTAQVARAGGAGEQEAARRLGAQAVWLSLAFGIAVSVLLAALADPLVTLMGGEGQAAEYAVTYLRIAAIGFPAAFLALGATGYLRGVADLTTPLVIVIAGNVVNVILEVLFVYGFDWGIEGSAWGTAIAQLGMGVAFLVVVLRRLEPGEARLRLDLARRVLSLGKWIFIRTTALMSSFVLAGAVATRFGDASIAAHQIAFQLWIFLALVLDAVAIAGQIIVGRELGAGRREEAYGAGDRMIWLSVALGGAFALVMLGLTSVLPARSRETRPCSTRSRSCGRCSRSCSRSTVPCSPSTASSSARVTGRSSPSRCSWPSSPARRFSLPRSRAIGESGGSGPRSSSSSSCGLRS